MKKKSFSIVSNLQKTKQKNVLKTFVYFTYIPTDSFINGTDDLFIIFIQKHITHFIKLWQISCLFKLLTCFFFYTFIFLPRRLLMTFFWRLPCCWPMHGVNWFFFWHILPLQISSYNSINPFLFDASHIQHGRRLWSISTKELSLL